MASSSLGLLCTPLLGAGELLSLTETLKHSFWAEPLTHVSDDLIGDLRLFVLDALWVCMGLNSGLLTTERETCLVHLIVKRCSRPSV